MKSIRIIIPVLVLLIIAGCGQGGRSGMRQGNTTSKEEKAIPVMINKIEVANLNEYISFTAKLEGITDIYLTSESSGKVVELHKNLGDWVNKGDAIAKLENDSYLNQLEQAKASLLAAEASVDLAEMQMETMQNLYEKEKISKSEYVSSQSSLKQAQSGYESALALVKQSEIAVKNAQFTAPVSGYISDLNLEIGSYVSMGMQVCRIVDNSKLVIKTGIGEKEVVNLSKNQEVIVNYAYNDISLKGKITGLGIAPSAGSVNYPVEILVENPAKKLLPGMVVSGKILSKTYENVVYTSVNNLIKVYDEFLAYVVTSENRAKRVRVEVGEQIERSVIIEDGLKPGDLLVIEGANSLSDNSPVEIKK